MKTFSFNIGKCIQSNAGKTVGKNAHFQNNKSDLIAYRLEPLLDLNLTEAMEAKPHL